MRHEAYRVHGMMQSYFTRKMTGYLDYKTIPWIFRRFPGMSPEALAAGFPGGVPTLQAPTGEYMWDSTSMILHLETRFPKPAVLPDDPTLRFLDALLEDYADEWLYRCAVGTRWHFEENAAVGGFELARDITAKMPVACDQAFAGVRAHVRSSCPPLGVTDSNIQAWVDGVLRPWQRVLGAHLDLQPYVLGERPSLSDFAFFGGNAAHFANDPLCRRWLDEDAPSVVRHTYRLLEPEAETIGRWTDPGKDPASTATLIAVLAEIGRLYLPWAAKACRDGSAEIELLPGTAVTILATDFLREARGTLLGRYQALRSKRLDGILEQAGVLGYFRDYVGDAAPLPDYREPPQPRLNRPFPPAEER